MNPVRETPQKVNQLIRCVIYLTSLLALALTLAVTGCQVDNERAVRLDRQSFGARVAQGDGDRPATAKSDMALFQEKCSLCHQAERALSVIKDPEIWDQTIRRMQYHSKGAISDRDAEILINFHITEQQKEIDNFQQICTRCHDDERINRRSMNEEQWLATIRRMQQKAPEFITDEKVTLLAAYFHRRELAMARIFYDKCPLCHTSGSDRPLSPLSDVQLNGLIVLANEEFGGSLRVRDAKSILASHVERQQRNSRLFEQDCDICHTAAQSPGTDTTAGAPGRSRGEWITFIAELQGVGLSRDIQQSINSQIDFHVSRHSAR